MLNYNQFLLENNRVPILDQLIFIETGNELGYFLEYNGFKNNYKFNLLIKDFNKIKIIGSGDFGLVFEYNNSVYKLTFDKNSYLIARKLIGKNYKHLVDVLDIDVLHNNTQSLYMIKMNKCYPMPYQIRLFFENMIVSYLIAEGNEEHLEKALDTLYNDSIVSDDAISYLKKINIIKQLKEIKEELKDSGLNRYILDLNIGNIMMKKNKICLIDFLRPKMKHKYYQPIKH